MTKTTKASEMLETYIKDAKRNISKDLLQPLEYWQNQLSLHHTRQTGDDLLNTLEALGFSLSEINRALAARRGKATSEVKAAAVRENGKKGGRPKKTPQQ